MDPASYTLVSGRASVWVNKTGLTANALQGTAGDRPLFVASAINSKPAFHFYDASTARNMSIADHVNLDYTTFSAFFVYQRVVDLGATENIGGKFSTGTPANQREWNLNIDTNDLQASVGSADGTATATATTTGAIATGTGLIGEVLYDGTNLITRKNGVSASQGSTARASIFNGTSPFFIGGRDGLTNPFGGYIGEVLFYKPVLSATNRTRVLNYLSTKWGIALA